jgi:outer membrane protein TolC
VPTREPYHRPELLISEYTAAAQHFAARSALAKKLLMVDGTFFSGRAGGAFEDQPLQMRYSWNAGIQGSLYFGGSTVKGARTREHTVPDFGETTATNIAANTASVGFLDALRTGSEYLQAKIERQKAFNDRNQARRNVEIDVREAYYNIQKGKIQIKGAEAELDYREKELDIARQKERMNLIEPAQSLAAESSYGDAVANHEEALSFYQVSLAGLERAVGMPLESIPEFR